MSKLLLIAAALGLAGPAPAHACDAWAAPEQVGTLDGSVITEASGLAVSRRYTGRLYHNNDSGDGPFFYLTDMAGGGTTKIAVEGFEPIDVEGMALGPCGGGKSCLYLGDIGDNGSQRSEISFVVIPERESFGASEVPLRVVRARYPDFPHDAEGFAVHPNGDLFLITKPVDWGQRKAGVAQIFKLTAKQMASAKDEVQVFTQVADIDMPWLLWQYGVPSQIATALDIAPDGKSFVVLTYGVALEVKQDLARPLKPSHSWVWNADYSIVEIAKLAQAEAIAYLPDAGGLLYDSEAVGGPTAPLMRQTCATEQQ